MAEVAASAAAAQVGKAEQEVTRRETELSAANADLATLESSLSTIEERIREIDLAIVAAGVAAAASAAFTFGTSAAVATGAITHLEKLKGVLEKEKESVSKKITDGRAKVATITAQSTEAKKTVTEQAKVLDAARQKQEQHRSNLANLNSSLLQIREHQRKAGTALVASQSRVDGLKEASAKASREGTALKATIARLTTRREGLVKEVGELRAEKTAEAAKIPELKAAITAAQGDLVTARANEKALRAAMAKHIKENEALSTQNTLLQERRVQLTAQCEASRDMLSALNETKVELQGSIQQVSDKRTQLQAQQSALHNRKQLVRQQKVAGNPLRRAVEVPVARQVPSMRVMHG